MREDFFLRSLYVLVIHLSKHTGWSTTPPLELILYSALCPCYFSRNIQLCCFQCSPWQRNTPVSSIYFPNAVHERRLHKTPIHIWGSAFKKTPASHSLWSPWAAPQMRLGGRILPSSKLNSFFAETEGEMCLNLSATVLTEAGQKRIFLWSFPFFWAKGIHVPVASFNHYEILLFKSVRK